jgi:hypothetical protein
MCGTAVSTDPSPGTAVVSYSGLITDGKEYHWQARSQDDPTGDTSSWVTYGTVANEAVRDFEFSSGDYVNNDTGSLLGMTSGTVAFIIKPESAGAEYNDIFSPHDSGGNFLGTVGVEDTSGDVMWSDGMASTGPTLSSGNWYLVVARKEVGDGVSPEFSVYQYGSGWSHSTGSARDAWTAPGVSGTIRTSYQNSDAFIDGLIAVRAAWSNSIPWSSNSEVEAAGLEDSLQAWIDVSPDALWPFNQSDVADGVDDIIGAANEDTRSGTTVVTGDIPTDFTFQKRDFGVDTSAPTGGNVYDGTSTGVDATFNDGSLDELSANWADFDFDESGAATDPYEYSIGTTQGGTDVKGWTALTGEDLEETATSLTLQTSEVYYFNVRATDNAGNQAVVSSDGQMVLPTLSFTASPTTLSFANLNSGNSYTDTKDTTLSTETNAYNGYAVRAWAFTPLQTSGGGFSIPWHNGDWNAPATAGAGYGYSSSDADIADIGSDVFDFLGTPKYAPFVSSAPGNIIADRDSPTTGSPENFTIRHRVQSSASQAAGDYESTIIYIVTAEY